jgi:hypothetical protein
MCPCEICAQVSDFIVSESLMDELKKENDGLKTENASLRAKLRSLSVCSLCAQPFGGTSRDIPVFPRNPHAAKTPPEDDPLEELSSRFSLFDLDEFRDYFSSTSTFSLADHAIAVSTSTKCTYLQ